MSLKQQLLLLFKEEIKYKITENKKMGEREVKKGQKLKSNKEKMTSAFLIVEMFKIKLDAIQ